ncbi:hypothetical protein Y032_0013g2140 [Ancylostoma ceylanicum]|uniref:Translocation protein SEC62 n=1 Tax=Ancylostoma ceylanicum TaxID=53326 RepID=A0A016VC53_9BILA|nr:hypothetical protein Y032_0013g2140 [Ancylostoma ceylanicum]
MEVAEETVDNFKEFCGISDGDLAVKYLRRCRGDLQAAVQLYFQTDGVLNVEDDDGQANDMDEEAEFFRNGQARVMGNEPHNTEASSSRNSVSSAPANTANWSVVQPWRQFIVALITLPFNFVFTTVFDILRFICDLVFGERTPTITNFREDVANFRLAVNERFGGTQVEFYDGTYDEAFSAACDAETLFAVYLFSPDARYSDYMVRQVLADESFNETILNYNILLWGADPRSSAGKEVARRMRISTFPCFFAVSSREHTVVMRVEMPVDARQIYPLLRQCALDELEQREEERFRRRVLRENRELMEQQEREYRESEERDRALIAERRRQQEQKEQEIRMRKQEEKERLAKVAERMQGLRDLRDEFINNELPDNYDGEDSIRVLVRYPSGETSQHRFSPKESVKNLFEVVFAKSCCPWFFEAYYGFPREKLNFCSFRLGSKAVDTLMDSKYGAKAKNEAVRLFPNRQSAVNYMRDLMAYQLFFRARKLVPKKKEEKDKKEKDQGKSVKSEKGEKKRKEDETVTETEAEDKKEEKKPKDSKEEDDKKKKKKIKLEIHDVQVFNDDKDVYVWMFDPTPLYKKVIGFLMVLGTIVGCLFPLWPIWLRQGVYYLSLAGIGVFGVIVVVAILRTILFGVIWIATMGQHKLWILPNLTEDCGFFESFQPWYTYEYCPRDKSSGKDEKKKKKKKEKESDEEKDEGENKAQGKGNEEQGDNDNHSQGTPSEDEEASVSEDLSSAPPSPQGEVRKRRSRRADSDYVIVKK